MGSGRSIDGGSMKKTSVLEKSAITPDNPKILRVNAIAHSVAKEIVGSGYFPHDNEPVFLGNPQWIVNREREFIFNLFCRVETDVKLKHVFVAGVLRREDPDPKKRYTKNLEMKHLVNPKNSGSKVEYIQFWEWPETPNKYTWLKDKGRYQVDFTFHTFFGENPNPPEVPGFPKRDTRSFFIDFV